jgi:hypothetical protein
MSCTASAAWSCPVLSLYCTEPDPSHGAVLSGRITTVAMSRSGQLGLRCTVELNCSDMSARLASASVTHDRALDTCEPSCVPGVARSFFIPVVHSPLGAVGYVATLEHSSRGGEAGATWQRRSSPLREAEPGAMGHVATSEPTSAGRRGPELRAMWQHRSSPQQGGEVRGHGTHSGSEAQLYREVWSATTAYVAARGCTPCSLS